uniref:Uncharacterized protein n=1 Tax=Panagrolaimus sp. ES5 TaxID=591445 RepID=A0AC34GVM7_9BILA
MDPQLVHQINLLKAEKKQQEELFTELEENYNEKLKSLINDNKQFSEKNSDLQSRLLFVQNENVLLDECVKRLSQEAEENRLKLPLLATESNGPSDSFINEYSEMQDLVEKLNEEKKKLQQKCDELKKDFEVAVQKYETSETKTKILEGKFSDAFKENLKLAAENKEMHESITRSMRTDINAATNLGGISLFDELKETENIKEGIQISLPKIPEADLQHESQNNSSETILKVDAEVQTTALQPIPDPCYLRPTVIHFDQAEIEFQKNHAQQVYEKFLESKKEIYRKAQQIKEFEQKFIELELPGNSNAIYGLCVAKRLLELSGNEIWRLRKQVDNLDKDLHELRVKNLVIPGLKCSIQRYEIKVSSLMDQLKKEGIDDNKHKLWSAPQIPDAPKTPLIPRSERRRSTVKAPKSVKQGWVEKLKKSYRKLAKTQYSHHENKWPFQNRYRGDKKFQSNNDDSSPIPAPSRLPALEESFDALEM